MFENDDLNNKDDFEEEYNKNEGENYVLRGQQEKIKKNLKNFDKIKKNLKKYEGKEISYNKLHNSSSEEDNEIDTNKKKKKVIMKKKMRYLQIKKKIIQKKNQKKIF